MHEHDAPVLCGALVNASAVASALDSSGLEKAALVCAGQEGSLALEDLLCAGAIIAALNGHHEHGSIACDDAAIVAALIFGQHRNELGRLIEQTAHARALVDLGLSEDIGDCARLDAYAAVPALRGYGLRK